jgi:hypothetical protein
MRACDCARERARCSRLTCASGHTYDESTLPTPPIQHHADSIYAPKPNRPATQPPQPGQTTNGADDHPTEAALSDSADSTDPMATVTIKKPSTPVPNPVESAIAKQTKLLQKVVPADDGAALPIKG